MEVVQLVNEIDGSYYHFIAKIEGENKYSCLRKLKKKRKEKKPSKVAKKVGVSSKVFNSNRKCFRKIHHGLALQNVK